MGREIKFRVWDKVRKVYHEDTCEAYRGSLEVLEMNLRGSLALRGMKDFTHTEGRFVLQQFIGLLDRNGKEIYEGDIVQRRVEKGDISHTPDFREEVYWRQECAGYEFVAVEKSPDGSRESWMPNYDHVARVYEVIGNIYQNPILPFPTEPDKQKEK